MLKRIAGALGAIGAGAPIVIRDLTGLASVAMIAYGAWLIAPAAGFIVGGSLLLAGTLLISRKAD